MKLALLILLSAIGSWALITDGSAPENDRTYSFYYQFSDKSLTTTSFKSPSELVGSFVSSIPPAGKTINLLLWSLVSKPLPVASEHYDRAKHFGTWIVDHRNGNCLNTRAVVLVRDSLSKVVMAPNNKCAVQSGNWYDPYGNKQYANASSVQIDHFVPLKHVYISGGFQWDQRTRCLYANYMGYRAHLVPVSGTENIRKSDATPYSYLPPNSSFICSYIANWLKIKKFWNLALIPPELQAISNAFTSNHCDLNQFNLSVDELIQQRNYMNANYKLCDNSPGNPVPPGAAF